jgi:hypothetical protein
MTENKSRTVLAIDELKKHISLHKLGMLLGMSHGYIHEIHSEEEKPSTCLTLQLESLAENPKLNLRTLERFWGGPDYLIDPEQAIVQTVDFLREYTHASPIDIFAKDNWEKIDDMLHIGNVTDAPKVRILLNCDQERLAQETIIENAVYVDPDWHEREFTDLIVVPFYKPEIIKQDWPHALDISRKRGKIKSDLAASTSDTAIPAAIANTTAKH